MSVKHRIKDESVLATRLRTELRDLTAATKAEVGALEQKYLHFTRKRKLYGALLIASFLVVSGGSLFIDVFFFSAFPVGLREVLTTGILLVLVMVYVAVGYHFFAAGRQTVRAFNAKVDSTLFSAVFKILGVQGELIEHTIVLDRRNIAYEAGSVWTKLYYILKAYSHSKAETPDSDAVLESLKQSELITEPFNTTLIDNVFAVDLGDKKIMVSELCIQNIEHATDTKQLREIFKGYFVALPLKRAVSGKTFISTEGDSHGFAHRTFWTALTENNTLIKETRFESNEFEKVLHVATSDNKEAREILTPDFMADLLVWWKGQKNQNIRISFVGNLMYMLFPDEQIRFQHTVSKVESQLLEEYFLSIATPLLHVLHVVEDVRR